MNFKIIVLVVVAILSGVIYYAIMDTAHDSAKKANIEKKISHPSHPIKSQQTHIPKQKLNSRIFCSDRLSKTQQEINAQEAYINTLPPQQREQKLKELQEKKQKLQRTKLAKKRYESKQKEIQRRKEQELARKNYYSKQKMFSKRDPQTLKNQTNYVNSKSMRAKVAQQEYRQRQIQMQERIKMQNKLKQKIPDKEND